MCIHIQRERQREGNIHMCIYTQTEKERNIEKEMQKVKHRNRARKTRREGGMPLNVSIVDFYSFYQFLSTCLKGVIDTLPSLSEADAANIFPKPKNNWAKIICKN